MRVFTAFFVFALISCLNASDVNLENLANIRETILNSVAQSAGQLQLGLEQTSEDVEGGISAINSQIGEDVIEIKQNQAVFNLEKVQNVINKIAQLRPLSKNNNNVNGQEEDQPNSKLQAILDKKGVALEAIREALQNKNNVRTRRDVNGDLIVENRTLGTILNPIGSLLSLLLGPINALLKTILTPVLNNLAVVIGNLILTPVRLLISTILNTLLPCGETCLSL